tara:strand:- start:1264 stop:1737 length:474 start_codon:yes stop_codon:yes gene_type:complete
MICQFNCGITIIFLIATFWFNIRVGKTSLNQNFILTLTSQQKKKYNLIIQNRFNLAMQGYGLGFTLSFLLILYNYFIKKNKLNKLSMICLVGSTTFLTQYFYYILSPKKHWMLENNLSMKAIKGWLEVYKENQWNYHFGIVLGIIAVFFLSNSFNCK